MLRYRNRDIDPTYATYNKTYNGGPFWSLSCQMSGTDEAMTDVVTPRWRERIARGQIINNPCQYDKATFEAKGGGSYTATKPGRVYHGSGGSQTFFHAYYTIGVPALEGPTSDPDATFHMATAKQSALRNVDKTPYAFAEDVFEIRKTISHLKKPLKSLRKWTGQFRKEVRKKQRRSPRIGAHEAIRDTWLEYRFAFTPTIRSVDQFVDFLIEKGPKRPTRRTARGFSRSFTNKTSTLIHNYSPSIWDKFTQNVVGQYEYRAGIIYEVLDNTNDLAYQLGLRYKDIPETLWAVTPYSFMVDRVANLSSTIRGLTNIFDPNVVILAGFEVSKGKQITTTRHVEQNNPGWTVTVVPDDVIWTRGHYHRSGWTPSWVDTIPPVRFEGIVKDLTYTADLLALVHSALSPTSYKRR